MNELIKSNCYAQETIAGTSRRKVNTLDGTDRSCGRDAESKLDAILMSNKSLRANYTKSGAKQETHLTDGDNAQPSMGASGGGRGGGGGGGAGPL